jgi:ABC-type transport system involved in multi-copper enzyme maturation permease subunit
MSPVAAPPRPEVAQQRIGFGQQVVTEWTKFQTIRGWVVAILVAGGVITALGLFPGFSGSCGRGPDSACQLPIGPGGEHVRDTFYFLHQPLTGDGSITARVSSMTGLLPPEPGSGGAEPDTGPPGSDLREGLTPWAKAGLLVKDGTSQGSPYAAVMATGTHGVRMQYNYVNDEAGTAGAVTPSSPRWLRLTRTGDAIVGEESTDGTNWTTVHRVQLTGLPSTVQIGLFATSPQYIKSTGQSFGLAGDSGGPTRVTATFDNVSVRGGGSGQSFNGEAIGGSANAPEQLRGRHEQTPDGYAVTGSGDIAPAVAGAAGIGVTVSQTLLGTFLGLLLVIVIGTVFMTGEYRGGMIRSTLAATPQRGRVLAAKAVVIASATFLIGLVSAAVVVTFGQQILRGNGVYVHPTSTLTEVRLIVGTAALLAVAALLALGIGTVLRRSATAVTSVIVLVVLPYLLALTVLPATAAQWLLRVTPAAAFALQQSTTQYHQVENLYTPVNGYFPLTPWAGFAVLCAWAAVALTAAAVLLRRRDA